VKERLVLFLVPILVLAAFVRFVGRDIPLDLEATAAPVQDAYWYLEAAQGAADGSIVDRQPSYDRPLWVGIARGWFAVFGTGLGSSHALGASFGVLSVLAVWLALRKGNPRAALLASLLLAASYPFAGLARAPLIYTPLAALMALVFALHGRDGYVERAIAWVLLAVLALAFKSVALVLAPGLLLRDLARLERNKRVALVLGAVVVAGLGLVLARAVDPDELERNVERIHRYSGHEGVGAWRRIVLAPYLSGLVTLAPGLLGFAGVGATRWRKPLVLGALGWAATVLFGLALLDYRPLRFYALSGPPLAILGGVGVDALLAAGARKKAAPIVAGMVVACVAALALGGAARELAAPLGVGATLLVAIFPTRPLPVARRLAVSLLVLTVGFDLFRDVPWTWRETRFTLPRAQQIIHEALGPRAVLVGPYASALAAGTPLQRRRAPELRGGPFAREGIAVAARGGFTHVALDVDQEASGQLAAGFAREGEPLELILAIPLRDQVVLVYRFHSAERAGYERSLFERSFVTDAPMPVDAIPPLHLARLLADDWRFGRDPRKSLKDMFPSWPH
jgi:hypothetical protein